MVASCDIIALQPEMYTAKIHYNRLSTVPLEGTCLLVVSPDMIHTNRTRLRDHVLHASQCWRHQAAGHNSSSLTSSVHAGKGDSNVLSCLANLASRLSWAVDKGLYRLAG